MIIKRTFGLFLFVFFLPVLLFTQETKTTTINKPTVAIMDLTFEEGVSLSVSRLLSDSLRRSLFKTGNFDIVTRENMEAILQEQKFQLSGCTSQECVVKMGKLLGAQKVFTGAIGKIGGTYLVVLKLLDVETGRFERIEEERCSGCAEDSLLDSIDNLADKITGNPETPTPREPTRPATRGQKEITPRDNSQMVLVPAGEFMMGSPQGEGDENQHPRHRVFLDAYYIDKYEVTVSQYRVFCQITGRKMPPAPSWDWQDNHPVVNVTWDDAVAYANYYNKRLPTEAEWEKAARAGSTTRYCFGDAEMDLTDYAWYDANSNNQTHPVGTKKPNAFGLYDMHGNVSEWCADWHDANYYANSPTNNPNGPASGLGRVLRGGGWGCTFDYCRSARRFGLLPVAQLESLGFRCASSPDTQ